jgi:Rha family phage regulatory protein
MEATIVYPTKKGNAATDTLRVAAKFGKRHSNVLRDVRTILAHRAENKQDGNALRSEPISEGAIFHLGHYLDAKGREQEVYMLNRAAFTLLVLGFKGKKAAAFKEEYVREFDRMETELRSFQNDGPEINLLDHARREVQVANSKSINNYYYLLGGVGSVIDYNRTNCKLHTGKRPSELLRDAKQRGVKAKIRTSAKELLRHEEPETACAMSLADQMVRG